MDYMNHGGFGGSGDGARSPPPPPPREVSSLENKVQEMASALRGECDKAMRAKMLAVERCHLKRDELNAADQTLHALKAKLRELQDGMQVLDEVSQLQRHVDDLKKQVAFQHDELVTLTDKYVGQQALFAHDDDQRHRILSNLHGVVAQRRCARRHRRNDDDTNDEPPPIEFTDDPTLHALVEEMRDELEDDITVENDRWRSGLWSHLTFAKAQDMEDLARQCDQESDWIRNLLKAYRRNLPQLGLEDDDYILQVLDDPRRPTRQEEEGEEEEGGGVATAAANYCDMVDHEEGVRLGTLSGETGADWNFGGYDAHGPDGPAAAAATLVTADGTAMAADTSLEAYRNNKSPRLYDENRHGGGTPYYESAHNNKYHPDVAGDAWDNLPHETRLDPSASDDMGTANGGFDHHHHDVDPRGTDDWPHMEATADSMDMSHP